MRRRAALLSVVCDLTSEEWDAVVQRYCHRCAYCGRYFDELTLDHVFPVSKGGDHTRGNVVPACVECNSKKGNRPGWTPIKPEALAWSDLVHDAM